MRTVDILCSVFQGIFSHLLDDLKSTYDVLFDILPRLKTGDSYGATHELPHTWLLRWVPASPRLVSSCACAQGQSRPLHRLQRGVPAPIHSSRRPHRRFPRGHTSHTQTWPAFSGFLWQHGRRPDRSGLCSAQRLVRVSRRSS